MNSKIILLSVAFITGATAYAGKGSGSHGSNVSVCGNKVELADLREVDLRPGLKAQMSIPLSQKPVDEQIQIALQKLATLDTFFSQRI